jgi:hypothetical protein
MTAWIFTDTIRIESVVFQERHELAPGVLPQPDDRRILLTPGGGELHQPFLGRGLGGAVYTGRISLAIRSQFWRPA